MLENWYSEALSWFGHVERMDEEHLVKRTVRLDAAGERPTRGRPQMEWMDGWME